MPSKSLCRIPGKSPSSRTLPPKSLTVCGRPAPSNFCLDSLSFDYEEDITDAFDFVHNLFLASRSHVGLSKARAKGQDCPEGTLLSPDCIYSVASFG